MASKFKGDFEAKAAAEAEAKKKEEALAAKKAEAAKKKGGKTAIGTSKGHVGAFAKAHEAYAKGHDVSIVETKGGWDHNHHASSDAGGKWTGGPGGLNAKVVEKDAPKGPPPKKSVSDLP
eukprot:TRINITY_DN165_c0_g1_i1.p1 TRINITY_DN165_c0_g1~~TRINITY_DN165_c0_g1_i1.p1  ORF type:complete len:120 (+),score=29.25 TRINITY_DN165_c0_g1_i1:9-368(+)